MYLNVKIDIKVHDKFYQYLTSCLKFYDFLCCMKRTMKKNSTESTEDKHLNSNYLSELPLEDDPLLGMSQEWWDDFYEESKILVSDQDYETKNKLIEERRAQKKQQQNAKPESENSPVEKTPIRLDFEKVSAVYDAIIRYSTTGVWDLPDELFSTYDILTNKNIEYSIYDFENEQFIDTSLNKVPNQQEKVSSLPEDETQTLLDKLKSTYNISVETVATDNIFYSDEAFMRTVKDKIYFISKESPKETYKITESLIRQSNMRYELMHANRIQKTNSNAVNHLSFIQAIRAEYEQSHEGKSPSNNMIARILNERKVEAPRGSGSKWHSKSVKRVLDRTQNDDPFNEGQTR